MKDEIRTCISQIDSLLSQGKYDEISAIFTDEFMRDIDCDELAYLSIYVFAYREERNAGIFETSFGYGNNTVELVEIFRRLKFYLWRLEFDNEMSNDGLADLLPEFIASYGITVHFLKMAVMTSSVNKELVMKRLSQIL
ncbi:MAG: hypothetical protein IJ661_04655 [Lachnospiraceae bacterium]|nr:hypothetical protein [Lachnospiraceae bacterium]